MKSHYPICLIQGFSGVGKSTLYSSIYKMAPKRTLCLATTGIAALNLMEYGVPFVSTIHSAFSLKPVEMYIYREPEYLKHKTMLDCIDTILIDEASMLDCSLMDWLLSLIEESEKHGHSIRIILFGDILQLPPVVKKSHKIMNIWEKNYGTSTFFFNARKFDYENVQIYMLTKVYRQKNKILSEALTSLRKTPVPIESIKYLNNRVCTQEEFREQLGENFLTVVSTNKEKNAINEMAISALNSIEPQGFTYEATFDGIVDASTLATIPSEITLYEGEKIMCTANTDDYKNGTLGTIIGFSENEQLPIARLSSGKEATIQYHLVSCYVPIIGGDGLLDYQLVGTARQIAAVPAYACTIHKTQGLTLDAVYYHVNDRWIPPSGVYVALSRCKTLDGIGLSRPLKQSDIRYSEEALDFYNSIMTA